MTNDSKIVSIQTGLPTERGTPDDPWRTGIFKTAVSGAVRLGLEGLEGDGCALEGAHGGPDRAVLAYSAEHYPAWREEVAGFDFPYGTFGENLTVSGLREQDVCIGDIWRAGDVLLQVSVPRSPCSYISRRCGIDDLLERVVAATRIGWLHRVLKEGWLEAGMTLELLDRPFPEWNVARAYQTMRRLQRGDVSSLDEARALAACPLLAAAWQRALLKLCEHAGGSS